MIYEMQQVCNFTQLLYPYRILKQPSDFLPAPLRSNKPEVLLFDTGVETEFVDEYGRTLYRYTAKHAATTNLVPMLEFECSLIEYFLPDCDSVEVIEDTLILTTAHEELPEDLVVTCHWCDSLDTISKAFADFEEAIDKLKEDIADLSTSVENLVFDELITADDGMNNHLIKLAEEGNRITIKDADYFIETGGEPTQTIDKPTTDDLRRLGKVLSGVVTLILTRGVIYTLSQFQGGELIIQGGGTVYLYNIQSKVRFINFTGVAKIYQCRTVYIGKNSMLTSSPIINSNVIMVGGYLDKLELYKHATFLHTSGNINEYKHIGVFCNYYSEVPTNEVAIRMPKTMSRSAVQGLYFSAGRGMIVKNGKEISFVTGHHDDPFPPTSTNFTGSVDVIPDSGKGTEPYPDVEGAYPIPAEYRDLSSAPYKEVIFPQEFMLTSAGPQSVADITTETFHPLRACMNWACGEFGPSIYGVSYGKLMRTWIMYEPDTAYRGTGKTLKDFILRLRTQVLSWGGHDIWERSYADLKASTWMTDDYALAFMQWLYNNIRYPELYGVDSSSDDDVIKAMSGMPTMNETTGIGTHDIPSRNQPVVWSVIKRAELNQFSGYMGYYVLYRPRAYDSYINRGVNPAVE